MNVTQAGKLIGFGLLTWLLPFLISVPFYSAEGEPLYDIFLIKSVLLVFSAALGTLLILIYLRGIRDNFVRETALLGGVWLLINWALDAVILLPLLGDGRRDLHGPGRASVSHHPDHRNRDRVCGRPGRAEGGVASPISFLHSCFAG